MEPCYRFEHANSMIQQTSTCSAHDRLILAFCLGRSLPDGLARDFGLPARLTGFLFESAGISPGRTNIGSDLRSRLAGLISRAILSTPSVSYLTPIIW